MGLENHCKVNDGKNGNTVGSREITGPLCSDGWSGNCHGLFNAET